MGRVRCLSVVPSPSTAVLCCGSDGDDKRDCAASSAATVTLRLSLSFFVLFDLLASFGYVGGRGIDFGWFWLVLMGVQFWFLSRPR